MPIKRNGEVLGGLQLEGVTFGGAKRNGVLLFSGVPAPPAPERPGIVGQPTLTVINDSEIRVNWDAPTSPGTPLTFYRIRYNDGSGNTLTPQLPVTPRQYTLTGLDASTEYSIQVRAWNAEGRSPSWSTPALATTDAPASTVPHTPAAPTLAAQSTSAIRAEWVAPNDGGSPITSYSIRWRIGSGAYTEQTGLTALAYDIVGLDADTEYSVSVRAVNSVGSSAWGAEAMESTEPAPTTDMVITWIVTQGLNVAGGRQFNVLAATSIPDAGSLDITPAPVSARTAQSISGDDPALPTDRVVVFFSSVDDDSAFVAAIQAGSTLTHGSIVYDYYSSVSSGSHYYQNAGQNLTEVQIRARFVNGDTFTLTLPGYAP